MYVTDITQSINSCKNIVMNKVLEKAVFIRDVLIICGQLFILVLMKAYTYSPRHLYINTKTLIFKAYTYSPRHIPLNICISAQKHLFPSARETTRFKCQQTFIYVQHFDVYVDVSENIIDLQNEWLANFYRHNCQNMFSIRITFH